MVVQWMKATQGQNIARRVIALLITVGWLSQYTLSQILSVAAVWRENSIQLKESAAITLTSAKGVNSAVMLILAFYFAAIHMDKVIDSAFSKPKNKGIL